MSDNHFIKSERPFLKGKTIFITGASRGIGRAIALRAARDGANIVIVAKTTEPHPKLPGTIFTVAEEVKKLGGRALPIACDIRDDQQIQSAILKTVSEFGGIDIVVNNASAISLTSTLATDMKRFDLMNQINVRGTFAVSKAALPHLIKSKNPHILCLSPPISLDERWFEKHPAYTMSKYGMSMVTLGLAAELKDKGVAVNSLWPKTLISTSALQAFAGDQLDSMHQVSRTPEIIADCAYAIFCQPSRDFRGIFAIDEAVMKAQGIKDLSIYSCNPKSKKLGTDLYVDDDQEYHVPSMIKVLHSSTLQSKY